MNASSPITLKLWQLLIVCLVLFAAGVGFGYWNWAPHAVTEGAAPAQMLPATTASPKGGAMAARTPDAKAKPAQAVPKGFKPERVISADITPDVQRSADHAAAPCPKVHIDATVVRDADGAGRVLISSPDGVTSNATDQVIQSIAVTPVHVWAAGPAYSTTKNWGAWVNRDFGRVRVGMLVTQSREQATGQRDFEGWALVGFNFGG